MNKIFTEEILSFFSQKKTYEEISNILQSRYPGERGYSVKSIKRYCKENGLSPRVSQAHLEQIVATAVQEVGPTYGRKMMTGYIAIRDNIRVSHNRVGRALAKAAPQNHQRRRTDTARMVNPIPYRADYFGHKIHYDQNEKLVMYGATHVIAIDGHSRFIVGYSTMPIKNNALIYDEIYRKAAIDYGIFHQVRTDCGKEFFLILGIQEHFQHLRGRSDILPYKQTQSKKNLPIERIWPEVNSRVNYPVKKILVEMDNSNTINMEDEVQKFCVSSIVCLVTGFGVNRVVSAWNEHSIPGRGVPSVIKENTNRLTPLSVEELPPKHEAVQLYEQVYRGTLSEEHTFGQDPLAERQQKLEERDQSFFQHFSVEEIFSECVNERPQMLREAILFYINKTVTLAQL
ncbi:uncharacterized protein LOC130612862 [Hydractinia symbiolongicarpus]|uniref:uncharacterized protein LOC130612862 n=1 Tax=Hydractinia symbiolongicarpus TaxID=13093 RepID=UPI0025510BF1|nr:uncharacterized protein LOC130612862 [Hydractinia symbiolongicarpus]